MEEEDEDLWSLEGRLLSLVRKLDAEKEKLEAEIQAVAHRLEILGAPAHVKGKFDETHTPLVRHIPATAPRFRQALPGTEAARQCDAEGFPRADLSIQEILEVGYAICLRACYAIPNTDVAYARAASSSKS
eukprot:10572-Rhodomonas_salina.2